MGNCSGCNYACSDEYRGFFDPEPYIDLPYITSEDVMYIRTCFDYLGPEDESVALSPLREHVRNLPIYVQDLLETFIGETHISFSQFYQVMRPRVIEMKRVSGEYQTERTEVDVSCLLWPLRHGERAQRKPETRLYNSEMVLE
jgi:hypothetical protein